jgi:methionine biosynthesis protein MetW
VTLTMLKRVATAKARTEPDVYYDDYWSGANGWRPPHGLDAELMPWLDHVVKPGAVILDVGCGDGGRYGKYLASDGVAVHGIDVSQVAVRAAAERGLVARVADLARPLPYERDTFDAAVCLEVLEHLVDPEFAASELLRVLKPRGKLLVSVPNVGFWPVRLELLATGHFNPKGSPVTQRRYPWRDPHLRFFNPRSLRRVLTDVGFTVERQNGLETQFLRVSGLERLYSIGAVRVIEPLLRRVGRRFYPLLARRCVALAVKPSSTDYDGA